MSNAFSPYSGLPPATEESKYKFTERIEGNIRDLSAIIKQIGKGAHSSEALNTSARELVSLDATSDSTAVKLGDLEQLVKEINSCFLSLSSCSRHLDAALYSLKEITKKHE